MWSSRTPLFLPLALLAACGFQRLITHTFNEVGQHTAHRGIVVNDQNRFFCIFRIHRLIYTLLNNESVRFRFYMFRPIIVRTLLV